MGMNLCRVYTTWEWEPLMTAVSGTVVVTVTLFAMPGGGIAIDVTQYNEQTVELLALRLSCSTSDLRESRKAVENNC